jgi:hypothetical protein
MMTFKYCFFGYFFDGYCQLSWYGGLGVLQWALKSRAENISSILSAHPAIKKADTLTRQKF